MCGALVRAIEDETFRDQLVVLALEHVLAAEAIAAEHGEERT